MLSVQVEAKASPYIETRKILCSLILETCYLQSPLNAVLTDYVRYFLKQQATKGTDTSQTQNLWVCGIWPSSEILNSSYLELRTMVKVSKPSDSER
jgi:hypothetical protein